MPGAGRGGRGALLLAVVGGEAGRERRTEEAAGRLGADLDAFDTFYIGGPTWYWTVTPPILTLLRTRSFADKTVVPFCTNDSQPGDFLSRFAELCPGADVKPGFQVQRVRRLSDEEIERAIAEGQGL